MYYFMVICSKILLIIVDYYIILLLYYGYHRFIHLPIAGPLYRMHYIGHHKKDFPLRHLCDKSYNKNGGSGWFETGGELVFGIPVISLLYVIYYLIEFDNFIILTCIFSVLILSGDITHSSYHLANNAISHPESLTVHKWLIKQNWFSKYQRLHYIHHAKRNANYGFFDFTIDRLFGTYIEEEPNYLKYFTYKL